MSTKRHLLIFDNNNMIIRLINQLNLENYEGCSLFVPPSHPNFYEEMKANITGVQIKKNFFIPDDEDSINRTFQTLSQIDENVDILLSIDKKISEEFLNLSETEWDDSFSNNLTSPFLIIREYIKMVSRIKRDGKIIIFNSISCIMPSPNLITYASFKAGLEFFTKLISLELSESSIIVNSVITPNEFEVNNNQGLERNMLTCNLSRDQEVAGILNYLLNINKSGMVGHSLVIDNGVTLN